MKRHLSRWRAVAILAPLTALALGSFWLYEVMRRQSDDLMPSAARTAPDFYVDNFSYVNISKTDGKVRYHFSGQKMVHNPQDDSYDIVQPVVNNFSNVETPMVLRADRAEVEGDHSEVHLYDNVRMNRPATADSEAMQVRSEYLLVLPDDDIIKTDQAVDIVVGQSRLRGTGMYLNNATRELRLASNVHGTYQAPAR